MLRGKMTSLQDKLDTVEKQKKAPVVKKVSDNPPGEGEYYCEKCKGNHKIDSGIGKRHAVKEESKVEEEKEEEEKDMEETKSKGVHNKVFPIVAVLALGLMGVLGVNMIVRAFSGQTKTVIENVENYNEAQAPTPLADTGVAPGPDVYDRYRFHNGLEWGSDSYATSSSNASTTLQRGDLDRDAGFIEYDPYSPTLNTLTMPASSSFSGLLGNNTGDTRQYTIFVGPTSTTGISVYLEPGTGMDMLANYDSASSTILAEGEVAEITLIRKSTSDILMLVEGYQDAEN